jgi:hypothetical protein
VTVHIRFETACTRLASVLRAKLRSMAESATLELNELVTHLADDDAQAARASYCRVVVRGLNGSGVNLCLAGSVFDDESAQALGLVARIGAALGRGAGELLSAGNPYAAAALTRQLVEVEYLFWTFADDIADAPAWLHATREERQRCFSPAAMRKRSKGRFRAKEYQTHCERGGHPDPNARMLLDVSPCAPPLFDATRAMWVDLGHHLERAWSLYVAASGVAGYVGDFIADSATVEAERRGWHERDPLARRFPIPPEAG